MPREQLRIGSLFTGYGGLDLAVEQFFDAHTVWTCDNDPGACKIIAHRYPDIPNLGDITKVDWVAVEPIDIVTGGWPCQPFSHAGKRLGAADERALWPEVARAVRTLRPRYVVLENVAAIASAGELARAAGDLAALGYVGSWRSLRAADVGAPHGRLRTFILAADTRREHGQRWSPAITRSARVRKSSSESERLAEDAAANAERLSLAGRGGVRDVGGAAEGRSRETRQQRDRDAAHHRGTTTADAEPHNWNGQPPERMMGYLSHGDSAKTGPDQVLPGMRKADDPQAIRDESDVRGHGPIPSSPELLPELREYQDSRDQGHASLASAETSSDGVQQVRIDQRPTCSPQGQGPCEQRPDESSNALLFLPPEASLAGRPSQTGSRSCYLPQTSTAVRGVRTTPPSSMGEASDVLTRMQGGSAQQAN
jgi:DNA (cytosine-5)-methyltransferase 1